MKQLSVIKKVAWTIIAVLGLSFFASCDSGDDEPTPAPVASFQYAVNETNGLEVTFTNFSKNATSYSWNFGDGIGTSTEENVTYTYADGGTFTVTLTATNETGSVEYTKEVTVVNTLKPSADFSFQVSDDNTLEVSFTNNAPNATSFEWDFGDGTGTSTEANPTYVYATGGTYAVTLSVSNEYGSASDAKDVTVVSPTAVNIIQNGKFDDESVWSIIQHNPNNNGKITIANGVALFDDVEQGSWGSEGHVGMNQTVTVESGNYQLDLDIITNGLDEIFFEVWVGTGEPIEGEDYNDANGATKVLSFNSWDCGETNNTYTGPMAAVSCQDTDGSITLDAGTYYVVIRGGGITWGDGITVDNVTMYKVD
jgi:PKD repeat protein